MRSLCRTVLVVLLALSAFPVAAGAQSEQGESVPFALAPVGFDEGYFEFETRPGRTVRGKLRITNLTRGEVVTRVLRQDVTTASSGGLQFGETRPTRTGLWLSLESSYATLPPAGEVVVPFAAHVPEDARPGEHFASLVVVDQGAIDEARKAPGRDDEDVSVKFLPRIAVPVLFRLPGDTEASVVASDPLIETTPSGALLSIKLTNDGNVRIPKMTGNVAVYQGDRQLFHQTIRLGSFVPDSSFRLRIPWPGTPAQDDYRVTGVLRPALAEDVPLDFEVSFGGESAQELEEETGQPALPGDGTPGWLWGLLALAVLLLVAAVAALMASRRRTRLRAMSLPGSAPGTGPAPPPAPAAPPVIVHAPRGAAVDLNRASVAELQSLPGVGPAAAERVVAHRLEFGTFRELDDLLQVEGFDRERLSRLGNGNG